jgi:hypothetical protein
MTQRIVLQEQFSSGTNGESVTPSGFNQRALNTVVQNTITGASFSGNVVTLPAGDYYAKAYSTARGLQGHQLAVWDFTNGAAVVNGLNDNVWEHSGVSTLSMSSTCIAEGPFVLTVQGNIGLNDWLGSASSGGTPSFGEAQSSGQPEVYSQLVIYVD